MPFWCSYLPQHLAQASLSVWCEVKSESRSVVSSCLRPHGYSPWNSPGQNTGVGSLSLLQGIFPTQGLNPGLPHCRRILYQPSYKGSPRILEWVAFPFSRGSSRPTPGPSASSGRPSNRLGVQPWALSLPDKELCLREALAVCTPPAPEPSAKRPGS